MGTESLFGGSWTQEKLDILSEYLNSYLVALRKQRFDKVYIDAFAGTGEITLPQRSPEVEEDSIFPGIDRQLSEEEKGFIEGSAKRALERDFDKFLFIEKSKEYCEKLETLREKYKSKSESTKIINGDANEEVKKICRLTEWKSSRAVMFLDPYATEVEWKTLKYVADTEAIDVWILVPVSAIERILSRRNTPDKYGWGDKLDRIFGDDSWRDLYREQENLFGGKEYSRERGADIILKLYKKRLREAFGDRLLEDSKPLMNSTNNRILFQFMFAAGNPNGKRIAHNIASHLINRI